MTIKDFVLRQPAQSINDWQALCKAQGFNQKTSDLIIQCADFYNLIEVNHQASFIKAINL